MEVSAHLNTEKSYVRHISFLAFPPDMKMYMCHQRVLFDVLQVSAVNGAGVGESLCRLTVNPNVCSTEPQSEWQQ